MYGYTFSVMTFFSFSSLFTHKKVSASNNFPQNLLLLSCTGKTVIFEQSYNKIIAKVSISILFPEICYPTPLNEIRKFSEIHSMMFGTFFDL